MNIIVSYHIYLLFLSVSKGKNVYIRLPKCKPRCLPFYNLDFTSVKCMHAVTVFTLVNNFLYSYMVYNKTIKTLYNLHEPFIVIHSFND